MFESLSGRFGAVFDKLTSRGVLSDRDIAAAMGDIRRALIEADVALPVVRAFTEKAAHRARGRTVIRAVAPGRAIVKIVHDLLVETLGEAGEFSLDAPAPVIVMTVGLQGAGKTTTTAKLALHIRDRLKGKVLAASLDTSRPAAQEQLAVLCRRNDLDSLEIKPDQPAPDIARRALSVGRLRGYDAVLLDTAGRMHGDDERMEELAALHRQTSPHRTLLVADALTGQDAARSAQAFKERIGVDGIILSRCDGDGRGGAALSMRSLTDAPILFLGTGEDAAALETFRPEGVAKRILGMGDIVSLVEKIAAEIDAENARKNAEKMRKGAFDLDDLDRQLSQIGKLGGGGLLDLAPGLSRLRGKMSPADLGLDDAQLKRRRAILSSMTPAERKNPSLLNASRRKRIASGSGADLQQINQLLKMHRQMSDMMKGKGLGKLAAAMGLGHGSAGGAGPAPPAAMGMPMGDLMIPGAPGGLSDAAFGGAGGLPAIGSPAAAKAKPKRKKRPPKRKKKR